MKRWILVGLLFGLVACNRQVDRSNDSKPRVVSTSTIIANLAERVGGQKIDHQGILQPGTDPHVYEPVPADSIALEKAALILYNGYNLEPGLIKLMNSAGVNAEKVAVGEVAKPLDFHKEGQKVADPHVWGDARNGIAMVKKIRDELSQLSPEDRAVFAANADRLIADLEKVDTWIKASIATIPSDRRRIVTTHDAFQYYANAYGLKVIGTLIGISTEEQPSARTVKDLALAIQKAQVPAIFAETTINPALITTVAQEAGVKLAPRQLYSDSIGAPGTEADSYEKMLAVNTKTIVEALGGKVLPSPK
jgi:manganese/iron transport system substrate-binding protein